ncbi:carboxymuconolactone decarboxylase family protein [Mycolicibacterium moriokaense]|nr:carboxymuconolactone decarboxylase family protein [Mycolicibacterium moriokaense]
MPADLATGADRLPLPSTLTAGQRHAMEQVAAGPRGELIAPFVPLLRAPELMTRLQLVGEYLRFGSGLAAHLTELVVLIIARRWDQDYEWGHHVPLAREAGLGEDVIAAVRDGGTSTAHARTESITGPDDVRAVWRLVSELEYLRGVGDSTFDAAVAAVGDDGVVEVIATAGYYTTLAMTMNAARTPVPDDYERLPARRS